MYGILKDNQIHNLSSEPFEGSVEVTIIEGNSSDTHVFVGYRYKHHKGKHCMIPIMVERSKADIAKIKRSKAEAEATVEFNGITFKSDDKAIGRLQGYISAQIADVEWFGVNGSLVLSEEAMFDLLELIMLKKQELFQQEKEERDNG